jgi:hypothetical protein
VGENIDATEEVWEGAGVFCLAGKLICPGEIGSEVCKAVKNMSQDMLRAPRGVRAHQILPRHGLPATR